MKVLGGSSRRRRVGFVAASALTLGVVALSSGVAGAAPGSFSWSGNGSDSNFSDGANWSGTAPQPKSSSDLSFPNLNCSSDCNSSPSNDVTGLKVPTLSMPLGTETGFGDYSISGNAIKIGTVDVTSTVPNGSGGQGGYVGVPLTLSGPESWSVDIENGSNFNFNTVAGASSDALTVNLPVGIPGNSGGFVGFPSLETGPVTFQGSGAITFVSGADFNGTTKQPVKFVDAGLFVTGPFGATKKTTTTNYGPLTTKGADIFFGNGYGGPFGINSVEGDASFGSNTSIAFNALTPGTGAKPLPGVNYPQVNASGSVKLGSSDLTLYADCGQPVGTKYTIVTGSSIKGTFNGIANGDIFEAGGDSSPACSGVGGPYVQIAYTATAVTATVVATPPGAPAAHVSAGAHPIAHQLSNGTVQNEG